MLHHIMGTLGLELYDAVDEKMAANREREWMPCGLELGDISNLPKQKKTYVFAG